MFCENCEELINVKRLHISTTSTTKIFCSLDCELEYNQLIMALKKVASSMGDIAEWRSDEDSRDETLQ